MKQLFRSLALLGLLATVAMPAAANELQLTIANGRVTLIAQDVPVRQILAEWARLGQTKIINGEKLTGPPLTLHIVDKPEREVLETVLRSASGYVAAPRTAGVGASVFETVMIMPTSRPPAVTASAPQPFNQRPGFPQAQQAPPMPQPMPVEDDDGEPRDQGVVPPPGVMPPGGVNAMPQQPNVQPQVQPYPGMQQPTVMPQPGMPQQPPQQTPMIAPRPGMLPSVPQATPGNPYQPQLPVRRPPGGEGA